VKLVRDPAILEGYLTDASNTRGHAEALLRPTTTAEVAEIVTHCQAHAIPLTVTAMRTSTTGGPVPHGGWLLSTERLTKVLAPDHVEGGVILGQHQEALAHEGLAFPPDPTSRHECSIGGAIACNASGARSFRHGSIRPWIASVEAVLPDGSIVEANRSTPIPTHWPAAHWEEPAVKSAAGFHPGGNLLDLLIGQEGTLGIVTRARLRLVDRPVGMLGLIAFFTDLPTALGFVERARDGAQRPGRPSRVGALNPSAIEYYGPHALDLVRIRVPELPPEAHCALFFEIAWEDEPPVEVWWEALVAGTALADDTIVADDESGIAKLQAVRHAVPAGVNEAVVAHGMPKIGTDFSVPSGALAEMMAAYEAVPLRHICFGHIGDNHLHLNMLPTTADELTGARALYGQLARRAVALGGTVSAEHGIGKLKRGLLAEMVGPDVLARFHALKAAADPAWILGRGTMLAPPGLSPCKQGEETTFG
jgi:D-lactate dehydrogenase (cytochrome)